MTQVNLNQVAITEEFKIQQVQKDLAAHKTKLATQATLILHLNSLLHHTVKGALGSSDQGSGFDAGVNALIKKGLDAGDGSFNMNTNKADGVNWPHFPNEPNSPFNPNDAYSDNIEQILQELKLWIHDIRENSGCYNQIFGLVQFVINLQKRFGGHFPPAIQKAINGIGKISGSGAQSESFALFIVEALRGFYFFGSNGNRAKTEEEMQQLIQALGGLNTSNNPFLQQLKEAADVLGKKSRLDAWMDQAAPGGVPEYTAQEFYWIQQGYGDTFFITNTSLSSFEKALLEQIIDLLISKYASSGVYLLAPLIMGILGENMSEQEGTLGAYGNLSNLLKQLAKENSSILNKFSQGGFKNGAAFKAFIAQIQEILAQVLARQKKYGGSAGQVVTALMNFLNWKPGFKVKGKEVSLQYLIDHNLIGTGPGQISWDQLAKDFNKAAYSPPSPQKPIPINPPKSDLSGPGKSDDPSGDDDDNLYNQLIGGLNAASQAISGQSQGVQTEEGNMSSKIDTMLSAIKSILVDNYSNGWEHTIVQNQERANS